MGARAIALAPYLVLPALLALLGVHGAGAFAGFTAGLVLLVLAAHIAIGVLRLPILCLAGLAAAAAAFVQALIGPAGLAAWAALGLAPLLGIALGALLGFLLRRRDESQTALLTLACMLPLAVLPQLVAPGATGSDAGGRIALIDALLLVPVIGLLAGLARLFAHSRLTGLAAAATAASLPLDATGLDAAGWRIAGLGLAGAVAATAGAVMLIGPAPATTMTIDGWIALAIGLFAVGRLGGARFGGCLLAALPLALLPRLTVTLSPAFGDLPLAMALAALVLQAVVRRDGSLALLARRDRNRRAAPFAATPASS